MSSPNMEQRTPNLFRGNRAEFELSSVYSTMQAMCAAAYSGGGFLGDVAGDPRACSLPTTARAHVFREIKKIWQNLFYIFVLRLSVFILPLYPPNL